MTDKELLKLAEAGRLPAVLLEGWKNQTGHDLVEGVRQCVRWSRYEKISILIFWVLTLGFFALFVALADVIAFRFQIALLGVFCVLGAVAIWAMSRVLRAKLYVWRPRIREFRRALLRVCEWFDRSPGELGPFLLRDGVRPVLTRAAAKVLALSQAATEAAERLEDGPFCDDALPFIQGLRVRQDEAERSFKEKFDTFKAFGLVKGDYSPYFAAGKKLLAEGYNPLGD